MSCGLPCYAQLPSPSKPHTLEDDNGPIACWCRAQGLGGVYLAGAWCGYGFHEDGVKSGITAAALLGTAAPPWTPRSVSPKIGVVDRMAMAAFDRFARASITVGHLRFVLPNGEELAYGNLDSSQPAVAPGTIRPDILRCFTAKAAVSGFGRSVLPAVP